MTAARGRGKLWKIMNITPNKEIYFVPEDSCYKVIHSMVPFNIKYEILEKFLFQRTQVSTLNNLVIAIHFAENEAIKNNTSKY